MRHATVVNTTAMAVAYTDEGHCVYPGEWASVLFTEKVAELVGEGLLTEVDHKTLNRLSNPDVLRAARRTDEANGVEEKEEEPDNMSAKALHSAPVPGARKPSKK